jgi:hypothetical protein
MDEYLIRVEGVLPEQALDDFVNVTVDPGSVQTVLHGDLPDQSSLAGILDYLDELGVEIVEVLKVPPGGSKRAANE